MSQQTLTIQPDPRQPLPRGYPKQSDALLAQIWHASGRGDPSELRPLYAPDRVKEAATSIPHGDTNSFTRQCKEHAFAAAVDFNQIAIIQQLYDDGYQASSSDVRRAAKQKRGDALRICLDRGADLSGSGILRSAFGDEAILDLLLKNGVDPNGGVLDRRDRSKGKDGNGYFLPRSDPSPLQLAAWESNLKVVRKLVEHGADPKLGNVVHAAASTPAVIRNTAETTSVIKYLLARGCDVNLHDDENWHKSIGRPLHWALEADAPIEVVKFLLDNGADPAARSVHGNTALDFAIGSDTASPELRQLLQNKEGEMLDFAQKPLYAEHWFEPISWPKGGFADVVKQ